MTSATGHQADLFEPSAGTPLCLTDGICCLRGAALPHAPGLLAWLDTVTQAAPLRSLRTPGGQAMAVTCTSAGALGWYSDQRGYRYEPRDPQTGASWPELLSTLRELAGAWAGQAGYPGFVPDSCLINRYAPGAGMGLHQDRDEHDLTHPVVSVSLGLAARFMVGGLQRNAPVQEVLLAHGDVLVLGGPARLAFHGVRPVQSGNHPATGACRINLTLRLAGRTRDRSP